jgi:hypothetical protein
MLTYDDLTAGRKKWVHLVEMFHPEVGETITYEQLKTFDAEFRQLRSKDPKYKVSLALWLIGSNAVSRGVYFFPSQKNNADKFVAATSASPVLETLYRKTLEKFGIV